MLDFAVVGGGPVGLLCAVALRRLGRSVTIIERDPSPRHETRSIGIHAASLAQLDRLGLLAQFVARGVRIERGFAIGSRGPLGSIDFRTASSRFGFALSIPQTQTEALLERAARACGVRMLRGACGVGIAQEPNHVAVELERRTLLARHVLACDGAHGCIRTWLGIAARQQRLAGSYLMAEFPGTPELGNDAWIFLADQGLVESFPLPNDRRRWVVEAPVRRDHVELSELCTLVRERTGRVLDPRAGTQASAFGLSQALAERFHCGRVLLLGDAAHVLSPFGGQGMNLGWLDAFALAELVAKHWTPIGIDSLALEHWARSRRRIARAALRQAAWNTRIGRKAMLPRLRNGLVRVALTKPFTAMWSRRFAMLSLDASPR
jgi:2-polyprenyl-6-methoxyphenol hydroxylase-like FAD-dependent oxidoreductase